MKIQAQQLIPSLKKKISLSYLVSGDDFLLVQEACDNIRKYAIDAGYNEREVFYIETGFNWENFLNSINNSSLFGDRTLIELRIKNKLTDIGSKTLQNYAKNPNTDKVILVIANKLDGAQQKSSWFKSLDTLGIVLPIWPIDQMHLPAWIENRIKQAGFTTTHQGIKLLADHTCGNLLAAAQEIEKLKLLYSNNDNLTVEQISKAITDNAQFNVFNLVDATLSNKAALVNRILDNLENENVEPTIILWSIANELRSLIKMSFAVKQGTTIDQVIAQNNVWYNRKTVVKKALQQYKLTKLQNLFKNTLNIDLLIKGANKQQLLRHELKNICLKLAGIQPIF